MMELNDENAFKEIYREALSRELSRPEIQADKKKFLSSFYAPAPQPVFSFLSAGFLIPAAVVLGVFLFLHQAAARYVPVQGPAAPINLTFAAVLEEARAKDEAAVKAKQAETSLADKDPLRNHMKPRVVVERIASRMGPTMVYQKSYREVPITVIWVFTGGGQRT